MQARRTLTTKPHMHPNPDPAPGEHSEPTTSSHARSARHLNSRTDLSSPWRSRLAAAAKPSFPGFVREWPPMPKIHASKGGHSRLPKNMGPDPASSRWVTNPAIHAGDFDSRQRRSNPPRGWWVSGHRHPKVVQARGTLTPPQNMGPDPDTSPLGRSTSRPVALLALTRNPLDHGQTFVGGAKASLCKPAREVRDA